MRFKVTGVNEGVWVFGLLPYLILWIIIPNNRKSQQVHSEFEEIKNVCKKTIDKLNKSSKKFYRDVEKGILGGVLAGIGHYFGVSLLFLRLLWVILLSITVFTLDEEKVFFIISMSFLFCYLILWMLVPIATTKSQKLAMKGREVNLENIEKETLKEDNCCEKTALGTLINIIRFIVRSMGSIFKYLLMFLLSFSGIAICLIALAILILGINYAPTTLDSSAGIVDRLSVLNGTFLNTTHYIYAIYIGLLFLIGIPFIGLFLLGIYMFSNIKNVLSKRLFLILISIWLIVVIVFFRANLTNIDLYLGTTTIIE